MKSIFTGLVVAVLLIVVLVGLYQGGWWLYDQQINRTGQIQQDSYNHQQGLIVSAQQKADDIVSIDLQIASMDGSARQPLLNQRAAIKASACNQIAQIKESLPTNLVGFKTKECQ
jgi:hypothetical protein